MAEELEELLQQIQLQNHQLQMLMAQKQNLVIQNKEIEKALEEVRKADNEDVYKSVGPILVRSKKDDLVKDLEEGMEEAELKIKALETQEKRLKEKIKSFQEKFQEMMPKGQGG